MGPETRSAWVSDPAEAPDRRSPLIAGTIHAHNSSQLGVGLCEAPLDILLKYQPVNYGDMVTGNCHVKTREEIYNNIGDTSIHGVFTDPQVVSDLLKELKTADLGMSVVVTGIHEDTKECCRESSLQTHTIEHSLGIFGEMKMLPAEEILQLTTMCGHGMVPVNLVEKIVADIKRGRKNYREAALELTRPCHCGIYNPVPAERLLRRLVPLMVLEA